MAATPHNVDRFNILCALLFEHLYDSFPIAIDLDPLDLERWIETMEGKSAVEIDFLMSDVFVDTMQWLEAEGFIRFRTVTTQGKFSHVVLTLKGFAVLGSPPSGVDTEKGTIIERVKQVLGRYGAKASDAAIGSVVSLIFARTLGG